MDRLRRRHIQLLEDTAVGFVRNISIEIPWEQPLVGIKGARGVGKSTLLLQHIKLTHGFSEYALYVSLDDLYFSENRLIDFAEDFVARGGTHLFLDEVHKYKNWSVELKYLYDTFKHLHVAFTGSSLLEILNSRADLSRRALVYEMQGLSFREYLMFTQQIDQPIIPLADILKNHQELAIAINTQIKPLAFLPTYLQTGYFPFYNGNEILYYKAIQEVMTLILEIELPILRQTNIAIIGRIKQLLYVIAQSVPFKPNITALAEKIKISRNTILEYIYYLNDAKIIQTIHKEAFGVSTLQKPEKIFLENTNYMYAIGGDLPNEGSLRETFFMNQVSAKHKLTYPEKGDFIVDGKYTFEVGGKNKDGRQLKGITDGYIAADGLSVGHSNKIPLWLFGFLY